MAVIWIETLKSPFTYFSYSRSTILVKLDIEGSRKQLSFDPGDHVAIFPANKADLVQQLIDATHDKPDPNQPIRFEVAREDSGKPAAHVYEKTEAEKMNTYGSYVKRLSQF